MPSVFIFSFLCITFLIKEFSRVCLQWFTAVRLENLLNQQRIWTPNSTSLQTSSSGWLSPAESLVFLASLKKVQMSGTLLESEQRITSSVASRTGTLWSSCVGPVSNTVSWNLSAWLTPLADCHENNIKILLIRSSAVHYSRWYLGLWSP